MPKLLFEKRLPFWCHEMSNSMTLKNDNQPWYREPWPWILMAGPGIVIIGAVITIWLAVVSNDGLVTDDY